MPRFGSHFPGLWLLIAVALSATGCSALLPADEPIQKIQIQQEWELQPGTSIAGHRIAGSLGDVTVEMKGGRIYAPFNGRVQPNDLAGCVLFSSPDVPAYVFRLCGVRRPRLGVVKQGDAIGSANFLEFAALRRQPDGKWAMVEPARDILERTLQQPQ